MMSCLRDNFRSVFLLDDKNRKLFMSLYTRVSRLVKGVLFLLHILHICCISLLSFTGALGNMVRHSPLLYQQLIKAQAPHG